MQLYAFPGSCALVAHIVLEWIGEPYTLHLLQKEDLAKPEFRKINPNGTVPALEDGGWTLYENAAILHYITDKHPGAGLAGDGTPRGRAEVNRWLGMLNSDVHPAFRPLFGSTAYLGNEAMIARTQEEARRRLRTYFERLDAHLAGREWLAEKRSIADPYLFVVLTWAHFVKVDLSGLEQLAAFEKRMRADRGVQKALRDQHLG